MANQTEESSTQSVIPVEHDESREIPSRCGSPPEKGSILIMWEVNVWSNVTEIIASLREEKPNWERMVYTVSDLAVEVGNQNLPSLLQPGAPTRSR
jgi:hypothetical protein